MKDFRKLEVWRKAHELALGVYRATQDFPGEERYGLTSQARRAAVSVVANIAEGCGRDGDADRARLLQIAFGSASEVECLLMLSRDPGYLPASDYQGIGEGVVEVKRMLAALIRRMRSSS